MRPSSWMNESDQGDRDASGGSVGDGPPVRLDRMPLLAGAVAGGRFRSERRGRLHHEPIGLVLEVTAPLRRKATKGRLRAALHFRYRKGYIRAFALSGEEGINGTTILRVAPRRCATGARCARHRRRTGGDGGRGREGPGGVARALVPVGVGQLLGAASGGGAGAVRAAERLAEATTYPDQHRRPGRPISRT